MRPATLQELCRSQGTPVPTSAASYGTFADFQDLYVTARGAIRTVDDLVRLVGEVVEDAAADGAVWIEPAVHLPGHRSLGTDDFVLDTLLEAGREASEATGVGVGWLVSVDRTLSPELAVEQAAVAARYAGDGVVAIGLANDEAAGAPEPFGPAFAIAREAGIISAPHAGEHGGPESVRGALDALGGRPDRSTASGPWRTPSSSAGWPTTASASTCARRPTSRSPVVPALHAHPLPELLDAGVPCSINADDPLLFGVGLLDEYVVCRERLGLDDAALAACAPGAPSNTAVLRPT